MLVETETQRRERLGNGISVEEATRNIPMDAEIIVEPKMIEDNGSELDDIKAELDELGISYSPRAGLKSLTKKLAEAKD